MKHVSRPRVRAGFAALAAAGLVSALAVSGAVGATAKENPKVAVVLSTGLKDTGYGRAALAGITRVQKELGLQVDTTDLVPPANFASTLSDYAQRGYGLVIADG